MVDWLRLLKSDAIYGATGGKMGALTEETEISDLLSVISASLLFMAR
jgi:hypothetical protein